MVLSVINNESIGGNLTVTGNGIYWWCFNLRRCHQCRFCWFITARDGIVVGSGITLSKDGDIFTGITSTTFSGSSGDGSALTGVANTDVIFTDKHLI